MAQQDKVGWDIHSRLVILTVYIFYNLIQCYQQPTHAFGKLQVPTGKTVFVITTILVQCIKDLNKCMHGLMTW